MTYTTTTYDHATWIIAPTITWDVNEDSGRHEVQSVQIGGQSFTRDQWVSMCGTENVATMEYWQTVEANE